MTVPEIWQVLSKYALNGSTLDPSVDVIRLSVPNVPESWEGTGVLEETWSPFSHPLSVWSPKSLGMLLWGFWQPPAPWKDFSPSWTH